MSKCRSCGSYDKQQYSGYCSNNYPLYKCSNCGTVSCECSRHNAGVTPKSSLGDDLGAIGFILAIGAIFLLIKFWWIGLIVIGLIVLSIVLYRSGKRKNRPTSTRLQASRPFTHSDQDDFWRAVQTSPPDKPASPKLKEFRYKWSIKGQEFIGTRCIESEAALRQHVERSGGKLIEILGEENKEGLPKTGEDKDVTRTPKNVGLNAGYSCDEVCNRPYSGATIQEVFVNYSNFDIGLQSDEWDMGRIMTHSEIIPCLFDVNIARWLYRINWWGKMRIMHYASMVNGREITKAQLVDLLGSYASTFGKWDVLMLDINSVELKNRRDKVVIDIELKESLKQALNTPLK